MKESEAKTIITDLVKDVLKGEKVVCIERKSASRLEHECTFAIIFKANETKELEVIDLVKELTFSNPDYRFAGSEADNKFDMEFVAILVTATIK